MKNLSPTSHAVFEHEFAESATYAANSASRITDYFALIVRMGASIVSLNHELHEYGPETQEISDLLKRT